MLEIVQSFNNNAALVIDDHHTEWVVVGKGIGFGLKKGDSINENAITSRYRSVDHSGTEMLAHLDPQIVKATNDILSLAKARLHSKLDSGNYTSLADHLSFAIQRARENIDFPAGSVFWEVQQLYPKEYALAKAVIPKLEADFQVTLPKSEAVFLTYHFVNVADHNTIADTMYLTKLIQKLISIVQVQYQVALDPDSFSYTRFITHLRLFLIRHLKHDNSQIPELDEDWVTMTQKKYSQAYEVANRMVQYLKAETHWQIQDSEKVFLTLHIMRLMDTNKN